MPERCLNGACKVLKATIGTIMVLLRAASGRCFYGAHMVLNWCSNDAPLGAFAVL